MNIKTYFGKSFAVIAVALLSFGLLVSFASAAASVVITSPNSTDIWNGTKDITWTDSLSASPYLIQYSSNFSVYTNLATSTPNSPYSWDTTGITDGVYKIKITSSAPEEGISDTFTVDNTFPTIDTYDLDNSIISPNGDGMKDDATIDLEFSEPVNADVNILDALGAKVRDLYNSNSVTDPNPKIWDGTNNSSATVNDGVYTIQIVITDPAGNTTTNTTKTITVDNTPPDMDSITPVSGSDLSGTETFIFDFGDTNLAYLEFDIYGPAPYTGSERIQTMFAPDAINPYQHYDKGTGTYTLYNTLELALFADMGIAVTYDATDQKWTVTVDTTKTWTIPATSNPWGQATGSDVWPEGDYNFYTESGDSIGNKWGNMMSPPTNMPYTYVIDNTAPTTALSAPASTGTDDWYDKTDGVPTITLACDDTNGGGVSVSGCDKTFYKWGSDSYAEYNTGGITPEEGTNTLSYYSNDNAGNSETAQTQEFKVDTINPIVTVDNLITNDATPEITGDITDNETTTIEVTVDGTTYTTATDNGNGTWTLADGAITSTISDGVYNVSVTATDPAGNTGSDPSTNELTVDTVAPTITDFDSPSTDKVYRTNTILFFTPADTGTAIGCSYSLVNSTGTTNTSVPCTNGVAVGTTATGYGVTGLVEGRNTIAVTVTDEAGNTVTDGPVSFVYDTNGVLTVAATGADFSTIQGAIDAWVTGITTIDIAAGTYPENITVDQVLKIIGPNEGNDPNTGMRAPEATISGATTGSVVTIASDWVVVDGLTITNGGAFSGVGIYSSDFNNLTVQNNILTNIGNDSDDITGRGIEVISSSSAVDDVTIQNNRIDNITSGLRMAGGSTSASGISIGWSTGTEDITDLLIQDNVISDIDADTTPWTSHGSGSWTRGYGAYGILVNHSTGSGGQTPGSQILNNTISDLEGFWAHGIGLEGDTPNATITGNTISDLTDNKSNTDAFGVFFQDNPSGASVTVSDNQFNGLKAEFGGVGVHSDDISAYNYTVTAEENWWGNTTGPFDGPLAGNKNPNGLGTHVTTNVDYSPFYNSPAMDTLVSVDPIASFALSFNPTSQAVNNPSTLTVTALDAGGVTVVNDTTTQLTLIGDNGASFGSNLLTMGSLGATTTPITNTITGLVNVTASETFGPATGTGTITFSAGSDVTAPAITNIQVTSITETSATITWDTDEASKSQVNFGLTPSYLTGTLTAVDSNMDISGHTVILTGLSSGTVYYFWAISTDASPNVGTSEYSTFTTVGVDGTPPTITLLGQNPVTLTVNGTYIEAGATANDDVDGNLTTSIAIDSSAVATSTAGTYTVTYNVSDSTGNAAVEEIRTVIVVDPTVNPVTPEVTLMGDSILSSYTVSDATTRFTSGLQFETNEAASVTVNGTTLIFSGSEITAATSTEAITLGTHTYNVIVTSSTGDTDNITVSYLVTANIADDNSNPIITLLGQNPMTLTVGDTFTDPGATANDDVDGNITSSITKVSTVATSTAGTYTVTYNVKDDAGNDADTETRTVIVNAAFDDTATLAVTGIDVIANENGSVGYASADDDFDNGWRWKYYITVPTDETQFQMKFSDFISGTSTIAAASNIRFYTVQASGNADQTNAIIIVNDGDPYSTVITLNADLESTTAGRQIEVIVEMKVPLLTPGGSYSGSYGVQSNTI